MILNDAVRLLGYALRGGQEDALNELRDLNEKLGPIRMVGGSVDERLHQAALLAVVDVPDELVMWLVLVWSRGRFDAEMLAQLSRHVPVVGINSNRSSEGDHL